MEDAASSAGVAAPAGVAGPEAEGGGLASKLVKGAGESLVVLVGALILTLGFRIFIFQAFEIPSLSMAETLQIDDRVMVNKLSYTFGDVSRGDVIVFSKPASVSSPYDELIKRVVAISGDTVEGRNNAVFVNDVQIDETYLSPDEPVYDFGPIVVQPGDLFVMGDNRDVSLDSRSFGPINEDTVVGRAVGIFWPLGRLSGL